MNTLLVTLISSVFLSGTAGYISYFILQETADIYYNEREKDEKNAFISLLSLITFLVMFIIYYIIEKLIDDKLSIYLITFTMTLIIMAIFDFYTFPWALEKSREKTNSKRIVKLLAPFSRQSKRNLFFQANKAKFIYMFTLEGKYITSGTLLGTTSESDMYHEYTLQSGAGPSVRKIEDLEESYSDTKFDIFVDVENGIQIYSHDPS